MRKGLWVLVLLVGLLAACGGGGGSQNSGGGGGGGGTPAPTVEPERTLGALEVNLAHFYRVTYAMHYAGFLVPVLPVPILSAGAVPLDSYRWSCSEVRVTGDATDADDDGIPKNGVYNGSCQFTASSDTGGFQVSWRFQDLTVQDPDDRDPTAGLKASGTVEWAIDTGDRAYRATWNLNRFEFVRAGEVWNFVQEVDWSLYDGEDTVTLDYTLSGTWTPDDPEDPMAAGTLNGQSDYHGTASDCSGWQLHATFNNVHDNGQKIDGGSASLSGTDCDGESGSVTITWSPTQICYTSEGNTFCVPN